MTSRQDIQLVIRTLYTAGFVANDRKDGWHTDVLRLHYRNNPDGSIRWLWLAGSRTASCLRFYHAGTSRARIAYMGIRQLFRWGMERFFSHGSLLLFMAPSSRMELMEKWGKDFSIFTGTPGPNRKSLAWYGNGENSHFIKLLPEGNGAGDSLIRREQLALKQLASYKFYFLRLPRMKEHNQRSIVLEDLGKNGREPNIFSTLHDKVLCELHLFTAAEMPMASASWWEDTKCRLRELKTVTDDRLPRGMLYKLECLAGSLDPYQLVQCSRAHGDFTPWNVVQRGLMLGVYDWELSMPDAPALWDAFHFVFQSGVLLHRQTGAVITRKMEALRETQLAHMLEDPDGSVFDLQLRLYLLTNITYYLHVYSRQARWHMQVEWLLRAWNEALNNELQKTGALSPRQLLCMDMFDHLRDQPYAALKWMDRSPESLSDLSDIDCCVQRQVIPSLTRFFKEHAFTAACHHHQRSFIKRYFITLNDGSLLSVDAIWQFKRKGLQFLDAGELLDSARMNASGVKTPGIKMDFNYTWLFYLLNYASIPEKYRWWFQGRPDHLRMTLQDYFRQAWNIGSIHFSAAFDYHESLRTSVMKTMGALSANKGMAGLRNRVLYYLDTLRDRFRLDGITITFSGVDGAGKSTIIGNIRHRLEKQFRRKVIVLRHRPSLLPILSAWKHGKAAAESLSANSLPRQGKNYSRTSSLLRFAYYYVDYLLGQLYIQVRYVWRGYIVLYDRYYFDFINDSRRSNINLPPAFTGWFYRFLIKPRLNFFLYAPAEDILQRKQELDPTTIRDLTGKYLDLFSHLSRRYRHSKYIPIRNIHLDSTLDTIVNHIKKTA